MNGNEKEVFFSKNPNPWYFSLLFITFGIVVYEITQHLIGTLTAPQGMILDRLQILTAPINQYFHAHKKAADFVLITTSLWIDLSVVFFIFRTLFGYTIRPALALFLFTLYRQFLQFLVSLPIPQDIIWYDPGVPSIFVDYGSANDLYFSFHTGVSLLCALELMRFRKWWLTTIGFFFFGYLITTVICFRFHYTMDVFTGILVTLYVTYRSIKLAPGIDRWMRAKDVKVRSWFRSKNPT